VYINTCENSQRTLCKIVNVDKSSFGQYNKIAMVHVVEEEVLAWYEYLTYSLISFGLVCMGGTINFCHVLN
jgi:hypothetical protein